MKIKKSDLLKLIKEFKKDLIGFDNQNNLMTNISLEDLLEEKHQVEVWCFKLEVTNDDPIYCYVGSKDLLEKIVNASSMTEINNYYIDANNKGISNFEGDYGPVDEKLIANAKDDKVILTDNNEIKSYLCNENVKSVIVYDHSSDAVYNPLTHFSICYKSNPTVINLTC